MKKEGEVNSETASIEFSIEKDSSFIDAEKFGEWVMNCAKCCKNIGSDIGMDCDVYIHSIKKKLSKYTIVFVVTQRK